MDNVAIRTQNLGKFYRTGQYFNFSLRESMTEALRVPFRHWRSHTPPTPHQNNYIWALRDVSFAVKQGEAVGIIGRNGAGKTTLLRILTRITEPTEGYAEIRGRVGSLLEVGTGFHSDLTGRENIYLYGSILGMKKREIDRKFDEIVAFSEVEKFIDTPVKRYSSGMQVRLAFSVAAHLEPEILLVDEVLAVGDAAFQKKCMGKMNNVASEGRTVLLVSHHMEAIMGLCSRAIWLDKGKVVSDGSADQVVREYISVVSKETESLGNLAERTDRFGDGRLKITGFRIRDKNGNSIESVIAGDAVEFVLPYVTIGEPARNVSVRFWIRDGYGRFLLCFWSRITGDDFEYLPPQGEFVCSVPCFALVPGTYSITIRAAVNGIRSDYIENAAKLEVALGDFFGTGGLLTNMGDFLCEHSWKLGEDDKKGGMEKK